jgi:hypothetical protein
VKLPAQTARPADLGATPFNAGVRKESTKFSADNFEARCRRQAGKRSVARETSPDLVNTQGEVNSLNLKSVILFCVYLLPPPIFGDTSLFLFFRIANTALKV